MSLFRYLRIFFFFFFNLELDARAGSRDLPAIDPYTAGRGLCIQMNIYLSTNLHNFFLVNCNYFVIIYFTISAVERAVWLFQ